MKTPRHSLFLFVLIVMIAQSSGAQVDCVLNLPKMVIQSPEITENTPTFTPSGPTGDPVVVIGDRLIFWVHGLGSLPDVQFAWVRAAEDTEAQYKVISWRPTYSQFSLSGAGLNLHNTLVVDGTPLMIANEIEDPLTNFIIAHSQGGLVSRAADKWYEDLNVGDEEKMFGGIVTFGSAHQGAMIINNIPLIEAFAAGACSALVSGPAEEAVTESFFLDLFTPEGIIEETLNEVCDFVGNDIVPLAFEEYQSPITEDYKVGAPALSDLNSYTSPTHKVAFYGVENEPVVWRTMHSLINDVNDPLAFQANFDGGLIDDANRNLLRYQAKYEAWAQVYSDLTNDGCDWWQWLLFSEVCFVDWVLDEIDIEDLFGVDEDDARRIRDGYLKGYMWWLQINSDYKVIIGAIGSETATVNTGDFFCECNMFLEGQIIDNWGFIVDDPEDCSSPAFNVTCLEPVPVFLTQLAEKPSDGIVLAESAGNLPGAEAVDVMPGSNHFQMRNDENTRIKRDRLLSGVYGPYFATDPRQ